MRILVAEPDRRQRCFLGELLKNAGFAIDSVENTAEAVRLAFAEYYSLLVFGDSLEFDPKFLCKNLRGSGAVAPILFLSSRSDVHFKTGLLDSGADDILAKPYAPAELLARIRCLLRRPAKLLDDHFEIDTLALDVPSHQVLRAGRTIALTRKEFCLLYELMLNAGQTLSKERLRERVWGFDTDPFSNTISMHIANLRRKIERRGDRKLIHTVAGIGFSLHE